MKIAEAISKRNQLGLYSVFPEALWRKLSKAQNISYIRNIFVPEDRRDGDVYDQILHSLKKLWTGTYEQHKCFEIIEKFAEFEPILFKRLRYRDHFIHQYLVFLFGLPILDRFKSAFERNLSQIDSISKDLVDIDKTWLLASTYHDIGYPIEQFETWLKTFLIEFLEVGGNPISIDMSQILSERRFLSSLNELSEFAFNVYRKANPLLDKNVLAEFLLKEFLRRNHGVVSSLILLNNYCKDLGPGSQRYAEEMFSTQALPSALAIALHVSKSWNTEILPQIPFETDPVTFLLVYCDTIQEWGRPSIPYIIQESPYVPLVTRYELSNHKISVTLTYDVVERIKLSDGSWTTTFDLKKEQVSKVCSVLNSHSIEFELTLESIDEEYGSRRFMRTCEGR